MKDIPRRLGKIERQLGVNQKPYPVNIAGLEMTLDELIELLKEIDGKSKGLPIKEEIPECQALCQVQ